MAKHIVRNIRGVSQLTEDLEVAEPEPEPAPAPAAKKAPAKKAAKRG